MAVIRRGSGMLLAAALGLVAGSAPAGSPGFDPQEAYRLSQAAIGNTLGDHALVDRSGETVRLRELQGDKPLLINLVFTSCPDACSTQTARLARVVKRAREALGTESFRVVTVGFDTERDGPAQMRAHANRHRANAPGWHFVSAPGDPEAIEALSGDLGFAYTPSPRGFDHTVMATVVDGDGQVYRHIYGDAFGVPQVVEPLKQLVYGTPRQGDGLLQRLQDRVRLICTVYDPKADRYYFDYSLFAGMFIGAVIIAATFGFLIREGLRRRRSLSEQF